MKKLILILFLLFPNLAFATTITFQQGASSYSGCVDTFLYGGATTTNEDTLSLLVKTSASDGSKRDTLIKFDISSIPAGSTIDTVTLTLYISANQGAANGVLYIYDNLRNWAETQATWNVYTTGNNWTTAGARSSGNDLTGTWGSATGALSNVTILSSTVSTTVVLPTASAFVSSVQTALDGSGTVNWELVQRNTDNNTWTFSDSEDATSGNRPILTIDYTAPAPTNALYDGTIY